MHRALRYEKTGRGEQLHFTFDSANHLTCVDATTPGNCGMARYRYDVDGRRVVAGDPSNFDYTVYVADGVRVERTTSYETFIEIQAFGERIALKRSTEWPRDAETPFALPPELPLAGGLLALSGLLAFAIRSGQLVLVVRRPAYAGMASLLVVALVLGPAPPPVKAGGGTGYYVHWELADRLGTGLVMVDDTGARLVHRSFTPFGQQDEVMGNATWLPVNYGTHLYDADAGLYAMEARWYDAKGGTFLSIDPVVASTRDPQSFNAYAYARSNPVSYFDPTGMCVTVFTCTGAYPGFYGSMQTQSYSQAHSISLEHGSGVEIFAIYPDPRGLGYQTWDPSTLTATWHPLESPGVTSSNVAGGFSGLDAIPVSAGTPNGQGSGPREASTVSIGTGSGEIEFGKTSEGRGHYTVTAVLWGASGGVSLSNNNPPGFKEARGAVRGTAAVITLSFVGRGPSAQIGPGGVDSGGNVGVNIVMTSDGRIVPVFFAESGGGVHLNPVPTTGLKFSGFAGIEIGGFRLGPTQ